MDNRIFSILSMLLSFAVLAGSAYAAADVQQTAQYYANQGETLSIVNFSSGNAHYFMLKLSGTESVVLKDTNGSAYAPVESEADLAPLVKEYLQQQFDALGFPSRAEAAESNFAVYETESERCVEAAKSLIRRSVGTPPYFLMTVNSGKDFPREYAALKDLKANIPVFEDALNKTRDVISTLDALIASRNADSVIGALIQISEATGSLKTNYINISQSHDTIKASFPNAFLMQIDLKDHCVFDTNETAAVDEVIRQTSLGSLKGSEQMAKEIALTTASRAPSAQKRALASGQTERLNSLAERVANLTEDYAATPQSASVASFNLTILWKKLGELRAIKANASAAQANETAKYAAAFESKAAELEEKIVFFQSVRTDYGVSLSAVDNATAEVNKVAKKFGANDDRVAAMQKDLRNLQLLLKSNDDLLRDAMTTPAALKQITANATALSARAAGLAPKENQLDFVLIGGVIILMGGAIGAVYYLRKRKKEGGEASVLTIKPK